MLSLFVRTEGESKSYLCYKQVNFPFKTSQFTVEIIHATVNVVKTLQLSYCFQNCSQLRIHKLPSALWNRISVLAILIFGNFDHFVCFFFAREKHPPTSEPNNRILPALLRSNHDCHTLRKLNSLRNGSSLHCEVHEANHNFCLP